MSLLGCTILVVEDNEMHYKDVQRILLQQQPDGMLIKYVLKHTTTLQDTLAAINTGLDLILLDLNLIDSSGFDTFEAIQKSAIDKVPVIVTTVLNDIQIGLACSRSGAAGYLVKGWLQSNPLLLHFMALSAIESFRKETKLRTFMNERIGLYRPLITRCKNCEKRIGTSRWKAETDGQFYIPDAYIELTGIAITDSICPECFQELYADDFKGLI